MSKKCDCFHPGDKIVCDRNGGKLVAKVISISGPMMTVDTISPKIGKMENVPVSGWELVQGDKARCKKPPCVGGENEKT